MLVCIDVAELLIRKTYQLFGLHKLVQQQFYYTKMIIVRTLSITWADKFLLAVQMIMGSPAEGIP